MTLHAIYFHVFTEDTEHRNDSMKSPFKLITDR